MLYTPNKHRKNAFQIQIVYIYYKQVSLFQEHI